MLILCRKISISASKIWWEVTFLYIETAFVNNMETMMLKCLYYFTVTIDKLLLSLYWFAL